MNLIGITTGLLFSVNCFVLFTNVFCIFETPGPYRHRKTNIIGKSVQLHYQNRNILAKKQNKYIIIVEVHKTGL